MLWLCFKMLYLIGPDGLVNLSFENFQKMVWMTILHVLRFRIKLWKFSEIITAFRPMSGNQLRYVKTSENFRCLILNLGMHIIVSHDVFWKFAYLQKTRYADFAGLPTNSILITFQHVSFPFSQLFLQYNWHFIHVTFSHYMHYIRQFKTLLTVMRKCGISQCSRHLL